MQLPIARSILLVHSDHRRGGQSIGVTHRAHVLDDVLHGRTGLDVELDFGAANGIGVRSEKQNRDSHGVVFTSYADAVQWESIETKKPGLSAGPKSKAHKSLRDFLRLVLDVALFDTSYHRAKLLRWLEYRNGTRGNLDRRTGAGVACHPRLSVSNLEGAEAADLDVLLALQRLLDGLQKGIDDARAVLLRNHRTRCPGDLFSDSLDQVCFGHECASCERAVQPRTLAELTAVNSCVSRVCTTLSRLVSHHVEKLIEEGPRVVWPRRCFGVVLDREDRQLLMPQTLDRAVVEVDVGHLELRDTRDPTLTAFDREPVILR